ncbi:sce7725 family protein [Plantibacter sp. lyk4-40-MEA-4]|uniref:sce7725 family protein n=1 Tax=Plantibacter sp. lyk4-40-MEA-4 TaxID=3040298 RepID=UPI002550FBB5|nr:sce7725 family protein [Plantibacter sp. lyk4-40-MEA-4]
MYFPYLYSRQAELKAIADVAGHVGTPQLIFPIIEPVEPAAKLVAALSELKAKSAAAYIIVNPHQGKLASTGAATTWLGDFGATLADPTLVRPTFKEDAGTTMKEISDFVAAYPSRKIGVILSTNKLNAMDLAKTLSGVDCVVFFLPTASAVNYISTLGANRTVDVSDNFRSEVRNKDYSGEEWLTNNHATWATSGRGGFADFTMLPGTYKDGGGPVGAIAVHLSFSNGPDLWIQHFISRTQEQTDPQATKFREVLDDLHSQKIATPARFEESPGVKSYEAQRTSGNYTNLSENKRQQISHHIYTVGKILGV